MLNRLIRSTAKIAYRLLGPALSTNLSRSWAGKLIFTLLSGSSKSPKVYSTTEGIRLKLTNEEAFKSGIIYLGTINQWETEFLKTLLKPNGQQVVIDIGAYVDGWYSLLSAKLIGQEGYVYAIEPHPEYFKRLKENVKVNHLKNLSYFQIGISNASGQADFYEAAEASSLIKNQALNNSDTPKKISIQTQTLDDFIKQQHLKNIRLVKIDVEGSEMQVLRVLTNF